MHTTRKGTLFLGFLVYADSIFSRVECQESLKSEKPEGSHLTVDLVSGCMVLVAWSFKGINHRYELSAR